mmetsp:Transcript_23682/g.34467  ORF Transcript_23682/g.34467 Transcript_23682/m.34467 type:complete len:88 (-) Transcript_23682:109-372(-)
MPLLKKQKEKKMEPQAMQEMKETIAFITNAVFVPPYADDGSDDESNNEDGKQLQLPPALDAFVKDVIGVGGHDAGRSQKVKPVEEAF